MTDTPVGQTGATKLEIAIWDHLNLRQGYRASIFLIIYAIALSVLPGERPNSEQMSSL